MRRCKGHRRLGQLFAYPLVPITTQPALRGPKEWLRSYVGVVLLVCEDGGGIGVGGLVSI